MSATRPRKSKRLNTAVAILGRLIEPEAADFSPDAARSILGLKFAPEDQQQVDQLSAKAQTGALRPEERAELEEYLRIADLLAMLKSKARLPLRKAIQTSNGS
jgi:hypothetical protein